MMTPMQSGNYRGKLTRLWKESPMYHEARARAWRATSVTECEKCGKQQHSRLFDVDHIEPKMAPGQDPTDIALFAARLNCPASGLQVLCQECHRPKTGSENKLRTPRQKAIKSPKSVEGDTKC